MRPKSVRILQGTCTCTVRQPHVRTALPDTCGGGPTLSRPRSPTRRDATALGGSLRGDARTHVAPRRRGSAPEFRRVAVGSASRRHRPQRCMDTRGKEHDLDVETHTLRKLRKACCGAGRQAHSSWRMLGDLKFMTQGEPLMKAKPGKRPAALRISITQHVCACVLEACMSSSCSKDTEAAVYSQ